MKTITFALALLVALLPAPAAYSQVVHALPTLPYAVEALEPAIDAETMRIHHGRHHKAYVDNLNTALASRADLASLSLETLLARESSLPPAIRNNAGGHWNHSLFWQVMAPPGTGGAPSPAVLAAITRLRTHNQNRTVAARATADRKTVGHLS
jgi:Fe-Mn family superoxide dismutase